VRHHKFERHYVNRAGWLRAGVLGANDGIVSVASLLVGVAASAVSRHQIVIVGVAGLVGGAMSMAAGEFVSVSSQADSERSDLEREPALAKQVALQLMQHDALAAHARDELGLSATHQARPLQAAVASALSFATGAMLPVLMVLVSPPGTLVPVIAGSSLLFLALLGALAARAGGAPIGLATLRVSLWGALAMAVTATVGRLFGALA